MESIWITKWKRQGCMTKRVCVCISERQVHNGCQITDQTINNTNGCISVHALVDQGEDVCTCACVCICVRTCI